MLRVKEAARRMGISESLVYELCASGALAHVRIGRPGCRGCIRISQEDIDAYLSSQKIQSQSPARLPASRKRVFKHVVIP